MSEAIGMMTGAYFVGRKELVAWINSLLGLSYKKVEECKSGAAYCQMLDSCYPGKVNMKKVSYAAKEEYQFINNWKELQNAFKRCGVKKHLDVTRLMKGSYADHLEMCQWFKAYVEANTETPPGEYDAESRRVDKPPVAKQARKPVSSRPTYQNPKRPVSNRSTLKQTTSNNRAQPRGTSPTDKESAKKIKELQKLIAELRVSVQRVETERDFYFQRLRDVEVYCQTHKDQTDPVVVDVLSILYSDE